MICPYCHNEAQCVTGERVYPRHRTLWKKWYHVCVPCDARVGCPGTTTKPLGTMANRELRWARNRAHEAFDPIWKSGRMARQMAYSLLARTLRIPVKDCHIALFSVEQCERVVELCKQNIPV